MERRDHVQHAHMLQSRDVLELGKSSELILGEEYIVDISVRLLGVPRFDHDVVYEQHVDAFLEGVVCCP